MTTEEQIDEIADRSFVYLRNGGITYESIISRYHPDIDVELLTATVQDNIYTDGDGEEIDWEAVKRDYVGAAE